MQRLLPQTQLDTVVIAASKERLPQDFVAKTIECLIVNVRDRMVSDQLLVRSSDIEPGYVVASKRSRVVGWQASRKCKQIIEMLPAAERAKVQS